MKQPIKFIQDNLKDVTYASQKQKEEERWDVEGILHKRLNQKFKFDLSPIKHSNGEHYKKGNIFSKSDKMVIESSSQWIIIDTEELHEYIKKYKKLDIQLDDILENFDWNIVINKVE